MYLLLLGNLPHYQHPYQSGTLVTISEPTLTCHHHPKFTGLLLVMHIL